MRTSTLIQAAFLGAMVLAVTASPMQPTANAAASQAANPSAQSLARDVFYNEVQDRAADSFWQYQINRTAGASKSVMVQVETRQGPIHRLLSKDDQPLTSVQQREENARLDQLLSSPSDQARVQQKYEEDEARLQRLMRLMPDAFLFDYDGAPAGDMVKLRFVPNPDFKPPTLEARVFHSLSGTLLIDRRVKRMFHLRGEIMDRVDFGWGLLGHIEKGGTFEIRRRPVNPTHWKTEMVDVHIQGKVILFKTVAQNQHEDRSGFKPVPVDITLPQARAILDRVASESASAQAKRAPASH